MQLRILKKESQPNGTTVITVDLDGIRTLQIVTPTDVAAMLTDEDIASMRNLAVNPARPPLRKRKTGE